MKKRGATIKHQNATMPGLLALAVCPGYETRLRLAVNALSEGWMEEGQFNDLADTLDMLQIGMASYSQQKPDPSTAVAIDVCREAMMSIRGRYMRTGKFGATGEELKAVQLLADVSLDFWNRRSGALFAFACQQLKELRAEQREQAKQSKEETEMNARDNAPALPVIDGIINAAHKALADSKAPLCIEDVAKSINGTKRATKPQIKEAEKQLKELYGLGILESHTRTGGVSFYSLTVAPAQEAKTGNPAVEDEAIDWTAPELQYLAPEDYEMPPADPALLASANRMLHERLEGVAHALRGCGLPALAEISGAEDLQVATAALSGAYRVALADADNARAENVALKTLNEAMPSFGAEYQAQQITSLTTDVTNTRRALSDALNEADRMRTELAIERQARAALQEQFNAALAPTPKGYVLKTPKRALRGFGKEAAAQSAAMAAARAGKSSEVFALVPVGRAVRGAEWRAA